MGNAKLENEEDEANAKLENEEDARPLPRGPWKLRENAQNCCKTIYYRLK
jgi:hypothetical protein